MLISGNNYIGLTPSELSLYRKYPCFQEKMRAKGQVFLAFLQSDKVAGQWVDMHRAVWENVYKECHKAVTTWPAVRCQIEVPVLN